MTRAHGRVSNLARRELRRFLSLSPAPHLPRTFSPLIAPNTAHTSSPAMSAAPPEASAAAQASASAHLDRIAENANAAIDADVATLIDSFRDILSLASVSSFLRDESDGSDEPGLTCAPLRAVQIRDKDAYRAAQEGFEAEARAHVMVSCREARCNEKCALSMLSGACVKRAMHGAGILRWESLERRGHRLQLAQRACEAGRLRALRWGDRLKTSIVALLPTA